MRTVVVTLAEAVFGSQLVLPGELDDTAESPLPYFLEDQQTAMVGHSSLHRQRITISPQYEK